NNVSNHPSDPELHQVNVEPITPKLLNKRTAHSAYIKHSQEEAAVLRDLVDHIKANYPLDPLLEFACKYTKLIQEMLSKISKTCPSINSSGEQLVAMTPMNKVKSVRFTEPVTSSRNTKIAHTSNLVSNKPMLSSTGVKQSTSASGSQPLGNTKKDKIQQTQSRILKNKVEAHPRKVKSSLKNKDHVVEPKGTARAKSRSVKKNSKRKVWITTPTKVPLRKSSALDNKTPKPVVTLVYSRKPRKSKTSVPVNNYKVVPNCLWYLDSGCYQANARDRLAHQFQVDISHETSVARSPQQNGVVERRNHTLIEAARTMLIYAKAPLFLWAEAVATAYGIMLFQPLFDEFLNPSPSVDHPAPEVVAPSNEVIAPVLADSTGSPSSTTVDQDAPSPSNSQTTPETEPPVIPKTDVKKIIMIVKWHIYGYIKNHKKTVKNGQARTRESEEYKKKPKNQN
ncbi:retrovirus-related pol polyprotein from transposon TNT 1-94, partial [Tanacetum coccineum]